MNPKIVLKCNELLAAIEEEQEKRKALISSKRQKKDPPDSHLPSEFQELHMQTHQRIISVLSHFSDALKQLKSL